jgi:putative ABC transport system permease protein
MATPPREAERLLRWSVRHDAAGPSILGDMHEAFVTLARRRGVAHARRWYRREAFLLALGRGLHEMPSGFRRLRGMNGLPSPRDVGQDVASRAWFDALGADARYAVRGLRRNAGFTTVAVLSLALGIGANTAIYSVIDAVLVSALPVERPESLVRFTFGEGRATFTNPLWEAVRERAGAFDGTFAYADALVELSGGGESRRVRGGWVSGEYFATLGVGASLGRLLTAADDVRGCSGVVVLSHAFWRREYAADVAVIGRTLSVDGAPFTIVGVAAPGFRGVNVGQPAQLFAPLCALEIVRPGTLDLRSAWYLRVMARLAPGQTVAQAGGNTDRMSAAVMSESMPTDWGVAQQRAFLERRLDVEPAASGNSSLRAEYRSPLVALLALVAVVLLIACVNVANLLLARGATRQPEIAVRRAIGAGRGRLMQQLLTESVLLAVLGAVVGLLFARWGGQLLVALASSSAESIWLDLSLNRRVLGFTAVVATVAAILFGLAPAWTATRVQPYAVLRGWGRGVRGGRFGVGKALAATQVGLTLVLVVGAGLLLRSLHNLATVDPGFDADDVLVVEVELPLDLPAPDRAPLYSRLLEDVRALPGVRSAGASVVTPIGGATWNNVVTAAETVSEPSDDRLVYFNQVSDGYFATLQTGIMRGRDFDRRDAPSSMPAAIVNAAMARAMFGSRDPIGERVRARLIGDTFEPPWTIVGVVEDAKYESLREEPLPTLYLSLSQNARPGSTMRYSVRFAGERATVADALVRTVADADPAISLRFDTLSDALAASLARDRMLALLSALFGGLALALAGVGLYGTLAYSVARRRAEMGVRLALGAPRARVLGMVLAEAAVVILGGIAAGLVVAVASSRLLASFLFGLDPLDPTTLAVAGVVLTAVAFAACLVPAWRAAKTDVLLPMRAT